MSQLVLYIEPILYLGARGQIGKHSNLLWDKLRPVYRMNFVTGRNFVKFCTDVFNSIILRVRYECLDLLYVKKIAL